MCSQTLLKTKKHQNLEDLGWVDPWGVCNSSSGSAKATVIEFLPKATRNSVGQIEANITQGSTIKTLESSGYKKKVSQDGSVAVLKKGEKTYRVYPSSTSTGQPSASLTIDGLKNQLRKLYFLESSSGYF